MITDKDELDAKIIIDMVGGNLDQWREIRDYIQRISTESAEQARKESDEKLAIAVKALEEASIILAKTDGDYDTLCLIRQALKEIQQHDLPDFARFENRSNTTTDVDK